jgi:hypothetical protein
MLVATNNYEQEEGGIQCQLAIHIRYKISEGSEVKTLDESSKDRCTNGYVHSSLPYVIQTLQNAIWTTVDVSYSTSCCHWLTTWV